jgi:probable O-glycosylation ligase (exosortase A-associated)
VLVAWMTLTSAFALNTPEVVWARWFFVFKIHLMLLVTLMLLRGRKQIDWLVWVIVISIGYFGVKGGVFTVLTGGAHRVWGPPGGMISGNNEIGAALLLLLPLMYYLQQTAAKPWVRWGLAGAMVATVFGILGSQSRGALVGLLGTALFLGFKSRHPVRMTMLIVIVVAIAILFMPETWTARMETISDFEAEGSAMSRLYSWQTMWNVALDRPLVGAGFGTDTPGLFALYAPTTPEYQRFFGQAWVAHSIYFQALGEHGFVGLALYLALGVLTWRLANQVGLRAQVDTTLAAWLPSPSS